MSTATDTSYAHTVARLAGVDIEHLIGLDAVELSVLYYGILSDDAAPSFRSTVDTLETPALEMYALRAHHTPAERAYCRHVLARRDVQARTR